VTIKSTRIVLVPGGISACAGWYLTRQRHRHDLCAFDRHHSRIAPN